MSKTMTLSVNPSKVRKRLLDWYDKNRRVIPWRALPGQTPNPYHVWLSEVMCQQTTVPAVIPYFLKFTQRWPNIHDLANAKQEEVMHEWAGLGYYARARNLHKCAKIISEEYDGIFPDNETDLKALPGIGDYTAAAIAAMAYGKNAVVVDGNVERVVTRLFAVTEPMPSAKPGLKELAGELYGKTKRAGDLAQSFMDLGSSVCIPKSPRCMACPLTKECEGYKQGIAADLPKKAPKKAKPQRSGYFYWIENEEGAVLFERRNEKEMLGGMLGLPGSKWADKGHKPSKPKGHKINNAIVRHSFTHFDLELQGYKISSNSNDFKGEWVKKRDIKALGLPSLYKKAVKLMT